MAADGREWDEDAVGHEPSPVQAVPAASLCATANWLEQDADVNIPSGGKGVTPAGFTDYTAEFLLTRGPYAILGYSWCGCTNGMQARPRAAEWDSDFGEPAGDGAACAETGTDTGVFERQWSKATVQWDCGAGHGKITPK